jgi:hypothetical protein
MATRPRIRRRAAAACSVALWAVLWAGDAGAAQSRPPAAAADTTKPWTGQTGRIEAHLKSAAVVSLEDIGTGVTHPRRAHLNPPDPVESFVWKVLPPGRRGGYWESYKSEIAAYELDKLLAMNMVPPAVERVVNGETGAAIMWLGSVRSVKEAGGKVPSGGIWGKPIRKMLMFDNLIANSDRNAGNILLGADGNLILIDHSRAFITDTELVKKVERVDAELWDRVKALTRPDLSRVLGPWLEDDAIDAIIERRNRMVKAVDKLVAKKGAALVIIQ